MNPRQEEEIEQTSADEDLELFVVGGLVIKCSFLRWPDIKRAIIAAGGKIIFQRRIPYEAGHYLYIVDGRDKPGDIATPEEIPSPRRRREGRDVTRGNADSDEARGAF